MKTHVSHEEKPIGDEKRVSIANDIPQATSTMTGVA